MSRLGAAMRLLAVILVASSLSVAELDECKGCQAYDCIEDTVNCGKDSYLLKYGGKYCRKFNDPETLEHFSPVGKEFVKCTTTCLKQFMQDYVNKMAKTQPFSPTQCDSLENAAFHSHVKCYIDCDFCTVCKTQKAALFRIYEFSDFLRWSSMKQIFSVLKECGGPHACFDLF
ncbi:hypothetical protein L596_010800 [Steinernema carpocapsae]|uniref:Saposin B-type domain-containing protein n=1 Tax=Steinernema carpocapsae TaxID=34508 RepID=A0A4U5PJL6_STECR|nr:hypothetical protein L596_010800 [Steinernema carpocapsae]